MPVRLLLAAIFASLLMGQEDGVPVIIDGSEVARVYSATGPYSAKERGPEIERRIIGLAEKGYAGKLTIRSIPAENATIVVAGGTIVMGVTELDAQTAGSTRNELAQQYADNIQRAIAGYRVKHTWTSFLIASGKAAMVWTFFCVSIWAFLKILAWFNSLLERWFRRFTGARNLRGLQLLFWERSRAFAITMVRVAAGITVLFEFSFLLSYTFGLFPQTAGISTTLINHLGSGFATVGLALVNYLPSGGFVLIVVVLTRYLLRALKVVAKAIETGDLPIAGVHPEMAKPTYQLARLVVLIFALVVAFPYLPGGQSEAFKGISIFLGLLLSLGSSSAVSNVLAGLVLTYMRPFRPGDRVRIADTLGDVLEKSMLVTRVLTIKNVEVVIPNSAILNNQILNYSALARSKGLILHTTVTIGYDAPWRTVHDLLVRAALRTEGVLAEPTPFVLETSLNDFHISYELNAYTDRANEIHNTYSYLHQAIQDSFNEAGVEIMSPTFYALRDGNTVTIPESHRPADYQAPSFRVKADPAFPHQPAHARHQVQASDS